MPRAWKTDSRKLRLEKQREVRRQITMEIVVLDDVQRMYYRSKDEYKQASGEAAGVVPWMKT